MLLQGGGDPSVEDLEVRVCPTLFEKSHAEFVGVDPHQLQRFIVLPFLTTFNEEWALSVPNLPMFARWALRGA